MSEKARKRIVPECDGCCLPDFSEGYCTAFDDPEYQWRNGECWGRCVTSKEMVKRLSAMVRYSEMRSPRAQVTAELRRELARLMLGSN